MMTKSWFVSTDEPKALGVRAEVRELSGRGRGESGDLSQRFDEFWSVQSSTITSGAVALGRRAGGLGLPALSPEQRLRLARPGTVPKQLWFTLARAAQTQPQIEQRAGITGGELLVLVRKEEELLAVGSAVSELKRQVRDSQRLLQGMQYAAQQRVLGCVAERLIDATPVERLALLGDAGPLLDAVDAQLQSIRDGQKAGDKATAEQAAALAEANEDLLLMKTLRSLQAGEDVDEDILRRAAKRYAERGAVAGPPSQKAPKAPASKTPRKSRRSH